MQITQEQKKTLRKIHVASGNVKAAVYRGNLGGAGLAMQFAEDCRVSGLWGALMSVEQYEEDGHFIAGTAEAALQAALAEVDRGITFDNYRDDV